MSAASPCRLPFGRYCTFSDLLAVASAPRLQKSTSVWRKEPKWRLAEGRRSSDEQRLEFRLVLARFDEGFLSRGRRVVAPVR